MKNKKGLNDAPQLSSGDTGLPNKHFKGGFCAICQRDDEKSYMETPCGHVFHTSCMKNFLLSGCKKICPICREFFPRDPMQMCKKIPSRSGSYSSYNSYYSSHSLPLVLVLLLLLLWLCHDFMYHHRKGVDVNYKKAIEWYKIAAEQGDVHAQYNLGAMYQRGQGVERDYKKAAEWFEKAANQGLVDAQHIVGVIYYHGQGVDVNYMKAAKWLEKAVEQGHAKARRVLIYLQNRERRPSNQLGLFVKNRTWLFYLQNALNRQR